MITGAANASYPVANLSDLYNIKTPFIANASGAVAFSAVLPASKSLSFLALLDHNGGAADTVRWRLYSDAAMTAMVLDSAALPLFPAGSSVSSTYPQNFPYRFNAVTARAVRVDLSANAAAWAIGAIEMGGFWEWTDVAVPRSSGFQNADAEANQPFSADHVMGQFAPRIISGTRETVDQSENATTAQDFLMEKKTALPFVWCWDTADATTYPRECVLVRNAKIQNPVQNSYPTGKQSFSFVEHLR